MGWRRGVNGPLIAFGRSRLDRGSVYRVTLRASRSCRESAEPRRHVHAPTVVDLEADVGVLSSLRKAWA